MRVAGATKFPRAMAFGAAGDPQLANEAGKVVGLDRIAVIAALNLANELIKQRKHGTVVEGDLGARLKTLRERVESALEKGQQLEL